MFQACGDAVIVLMSDLQDPPEVLAQLLEQWEDGMPIVIAVKRQSREAAPMFLARTLFYRLVNRLADDIETYENFTGFGLYDRQVIDLVRQFGDPYPYFRGMIAEIGLPHAEVEYVQERRKHGKTKNNFYTLYDIAMLGITKLSKVPLRLVTFAGLRRVVRFLCLGGIAYFAYKLFFWRQFYGRNRSHRDRNVLSGIAAAAFHGDHRRVHRQHSHPGAQPSAGRRTRKIEFPVPARRTQPARYSRSGAAAGGSQYAGTQVF